MFNEARLLDRVSYGSQFGHEFNTRVTRLRSGHERRNAGWSMPLGKYRVMYQALLPEHHQYVLDAHMACMGSLIPFRFRNLTDFVATSQPIGTGTGAEQTLQLEKVYTFGTFSLSRKISKPVSGTVKVYEDGVLVPAVVDYETGSVVLTASSGSAITWTGEFDIPVRFESDSIDVDPVARTGAGFALRADVGLVEVRL